MHKLACCFLPLIPLVGLIGCTRPTSPSPALPSVTVAQARMLTLTNWDEYPGHVEAVEMVELRPRVSGYLESIHFEDGAEVKAGDRLFEIDPRPYQADLARAQADRQKAASEHQRLQADRQRVQADHQRLQAELQRAQSRAELARNDLTRAETLRTSKAISEEELDNRSKALREAQATVAAAQAAVAAAQATVTAADAAVTAADASVAAAQAAEVNAKLNLDYSHITAPITGRIGRRMVTAGNLIQTGGTPTVLATIVTLNPIYCYFDVEERLFQQYRTQVIKGGKQKNGLLPCVMALAGESGFPHQGRVDFFDNQVNPKTGTIRMRAIFANENRALIPGMFATVRLPAGPPVQALTVPAVAIGSDQGNKFVLVANFSNVVEKRDVQVDRQHGPLRVVTKGLTPQDRVIVNGLMMARPGSPVRVMDEPTREAPSIPASK